MKRLVFLILCVIVFTLVASDSIAQQGTAIKVKSSEVLTGVVIVQILKDGTPYELQCNEGSSWCKTLKSGTYSTEFWHVRLPECRGVSVRQRDSVDRSGWAILPDQEVGADWATAPMGKKIPQFCPSRRIIGAGFPSGTRIVLSISSF